MSPPTILHLIESITRGGAMRASIAIGKYIPRIFPSAHIVAPVGPGPTEREGVHLAEEAGMQAVIPRHAQELHELISRADIVHLNWWNNPHVDAFLRSTLPANRLVVWCHVGGHAPPQIIPDELFSYADYVVACSPYTYESAAFQKLDRATRERCTAMAYGPADFERIGEVKKQPHETFNVGYIGTIHFAKMHRRYVHMSASAQIPNVRFIVCGGGGAEQQLERDIQELGCKDKFELRGYVEDVRSILSTLDVYGYPLCEDNYSGSEINLQEVMFAGIPVVAFPYGGISRLVVDGVTGLLVRSEKQYAEALEFLYHNPQKRMELGANAKKYAERLFGAAPAAQVFSSIYGKLLALPKKSRVWRDLSQEKPPTTPAERFIHSLGDWGAPFLKSVSGTTLDELLAGDAHVQQLSDLMKTGGIATWQRAYPSDPWLTFWNGLAELGSGNAPRALQLFVEASHHGFTHWRLGWYLAVSAEQCGNQPVALKTATLVMQFDPNFPGLQELMQRITKN